MADNILKGIVIIDASGAETSLRLLDKRVGDAEKSLKRVAPSANQANQALLNLGRVAQDAPFGFIGIANNLNPLLESFQRLKTESKSSGGALKALASSLTGAGGIGIALSVITAAVSFASNGFGAWTRGFSNTSKAAKKLADDLEESAARITEITSKSLVDIANGARGNDEASIVKVQALTSAVLDQTKSYKERNNALNQLKEINKNYFGDLTLEAASLKTLTSRVEEYTNAIIAASVTKAFADEIANASKELFTQINLYNKLGKSADDAKRTLDATQRTQIQGSAGGGMEVVTAEYNRASKAYGKATQALREQGTVVNSLTTKIAEFRKGLVDAINTELKFKPLTAPTLDKPKPFKDLYEDPFKGLKLNFNFREPYRLVELEAKELREKVRKELELPIKPNIKIKPAPAGPGLFDSYLSGLTKNLNDSINAFIDNVKIEGLSAIGESIGAALTGGDIGGVFASFANVIASGLTQLGKQFIEFGILAKAAKQALATLFTNPFAAIAVGIGLVAAGAALRGAMGKGINGARALGGPVSSGGAYLVGENGPEIFSPSMSGSIIPNNRMGNYGGSSLAGRVQFVISGNNLVGVLSSANRSQGRLV